MSKPAPFKKNNPQEDPEIKSLIFREFRDVSVTDPLRQGDVLESVNVGATMWHRHLLVITADCDFANDKHQGRVTCVPILTANEYLLQMRIPALRDRIIKKNLATLRAAIASSANPNITDQRLREWTTEEDPDHIVKALNQVGNQAVRVHAALTAIRLADHPASNLAGAISQLVEAELAGPEPPKRENVVRSMVEGIRNSYNQPPGDAMFLSAIGPSHEEGYFVYLRHLEQVWQHEVSTSHARTVVKYRRISRMKDRFALALVQRFGMVFMSIGLPSDYEEMRNLYSQEMGDEIK